MHALAASIGRRAGAACAGLDARDAGGDDAMPAPALFRLAA
jgi:hypothetical protein